MAAVILYGIPNCDTTKKAITWLHKNNIAFSFHDYKQEGISEKKLEDWCEKKGLQLIFNKRSTTWKELSASEQKKAADQVSAIKLMTAHNSIIKRPVIEKGNNLLVGYNETEYNKHLK
jgi:arsenate reductase (glutaredoxin)